MKSYEEQDLEQAKTSHWNSEATVRRWNKRGKKNEGVRGKDLKEKTGREMLVERKKTKSTLSIH